MYTVIYKYYGSYTKERKFDNYAAAKNFFYYTMNRMKGVTSAELKVA
jgi:hypothetical protein